MTLYMNPSNCQLLPSYINIGFLVHSSSRSTCPIFCVVPLPPGAAAVFFSGSSSAFRSITGPRLKSSRDTEDGGVEGKAPCGGGPYGPTVAEGSHERRRRLYRVRAVLLQSGGTWGHRPYKQSRTGARAPSNQSTVALARFSLPDRT